MHGASTCPNISGHLLTPALANASSTYGQRPKKALCTSNQPQLSGPFNEFHIFVRRKIFQIWWTGGSRLVLEREKWKEEGPNPPPPSV